MFLQYHDFPEDKVMVVEHSEHDGLVSGGTGVPPTATELADWHPRSDLAIPHSIRLDYVGPYLATVTAEIADVAALVPMNVHALIAEASAEIARFDAEMGAYVMPFSAILLRSESAASSQIENLTASAKAVALAELGDSSKRNAGIIAANATAMRAAIDLADELDAAAIIAMHGALLGGSHPEMVGRWRDQQVWIGGTGYGPHTATYVAPRHERVPAAIGDLVRFMRRTDLPALLQASIAHAQFETIHPFPDGNGRTGRALIHSLLRHRGLTRAVTVPVSAGLLTDTDSYFAALTTYRSGDIVPIAELMSHASFVAINNGRQLVGELRDIRSRWSDLVSARRQSSVWALLDLLLRQPAVSSEIVQRELHVSVTAANASIELLADAGVLSQAAGNPKWGRKWTAPDVLGALDGFAARCGRRVH